MKTVNRPSKLGVALAGLMLCGGASSAHAAETPATILEPELAGDISADLRERQKELHGLLSETAQDLQLTIDVTADPPTVSDATIAAVAKLRGEVVVRTTVRALGDDRLVLRMVAARPDSEVLAMRVEEVTADELEVRAVVMLRDVVGDVPSRAAVVDKNGNERRKLAKPVRSVGKSILAVNGTLYGGFVGYSLQRASESDDPRLLYPLIAVGAGVGLGATLIVADEWDVGVGDAWYLASAWWPAVSGHLIYEGRFGDTRTANADEAWSFGLVGSVTGLTVTTAGLLHGGMGDGGAIMAHSGGAFGLIIGGLAEFAVTGDLVTEEIPFAGMGYGAAAGWLLASSTAMIFHPPPGRTLVIDLGILLGGLAGASAGSPLLFDEPNADKVRGWVAASGGGLVAGGIIAAVLSIPADAAPAEGEKDKEEPVGISRLELPRLGMLPIQTSLGELHVPAVGVSWTGQLR